MLRITRGNFFKIIIIIFTLSSALASANEKMKIYQTHIEMAKNYESQGKLEMAIKEYQKAITLNPKDPITYYHRAKAYREVRQYDKELEDYNRILALNPDTELAYQVYSSRGLFYANQGNHKRAIEEYIKAIELNSKDPSLYCLRGNSYFMMGQYEKGIEDLEKAIKLDSNDLYIFDASRIRWNYGNFLRRKGNYENAIKEYSISITLTPNNPHPYVGRGYTYILKGDKKRAMVDLQKACYLGDRNSCHILEILKNKKN